MERQTAIYKAFYEGLMLSIVHFMYRSEGLHCLESIKKKLEVVEKIDKPDDFNFYHRYTLQCIDDAIENTNIYLQNKSKEQ